MTGFDATREALLEESPAAAVMQAAPVRTRGVWSRTLRRPEGAVGLALTLLVVLVALLGPLLSSGDPNAFVATPYAQPAPGLPFGADVLGRDVLTRFLHGGVRLLSISALATLFGVTVGAALGILIGASRSPLGQATMRVVDVALAFPFYLFVLLLISITDASLGLVALIVGATHIAPVTRIVRPVAAELAQRQFVQNAEAIGVPRRVILFREILPNLTPILSVEYGLRFTFSVGIVAALSYLGFGTAPGIADWGSMISANQVALTIQPWPVLLPCLAIGALAVGTNLLTDAFARSFAVGER